MLPSPSAEQSAIAGRLAADLTSYRDGVRGLLQHRWDPAKYRELSELFDRIHMQAGALPRLSVTWTEVLISRAELMQALWNLRAPTRINGRVEALHAQHELLVDELRVRCLGFTQPARASVAPAAREPERIAPTEPKG